ncbi:MAG: hypothetical protein ACYDBW_04405 [Sulfuricaulis sp.]
MSADTLLVILLVWAVAGLLVAITFGKAVQAADTPHNENEHLPHAAGYVQYFRNSKRQSDTHLSNSQRGARSGTKNRKTG